MRNIDFGSWHNLLATLLGLVLVTLMGVGIRLMMVTIQQRRERANRQIMSGCAA